MLVVIAVLLGLILFVLAPQLVLWLLGAGLFVLAAAAAIGLALLAWFNATWDQVACAGAAAAAVLSAVWFKQSRPATWQVCAEVFSWTMNQVARWLTLALLALIALGCGYAAVSVTLHQGLGVDAAGLGAMSLAFVAITLKVFRDSATVPVGETLRTEA